jgi:hypothetical protein
LQELLNDKDNNNLYANLSLAKSILNENIIDNIINKVDALKNIVDNIQNMSINNLNDDNENDNQENCSISFQSCIDNESDKMIIEDKNENHIKKDKYEYISTQTA